VTSLNKFKTGTGSSSMSGLFNHTSLSPPQTRATVPLTCSYNTYYCTASCSSRVTMCPRLADFHVILQTQPPSTTHARIVVVTGSHRQAGSRRGACLLPPDCRSTSGVIFLICRLILKTTFCRSFSGATQPCFSPHLSRSASNIYIYM
jgi:hypothetical protein